MNAQSFLDNFHTIARASGGVSRVRDLVYFFAITGGLSRPEAGDSDAKSILDDTLHAKLDYYEENSVRQGARKHSEIFQVVKRVPSHWVMVAAGDLVHLINGRAFKAADWKKSGLPIIRIQNLNNPAAPFNYFQGEVAEGHRVRTGDMLLSWSGTPGTSFGAFIWNGGDAVLNQHIFKVAIYSSKISKEYLRMAINASLDALIGSARGGVGLKHVTKGQIESLQIPLPPLEEQRRIVAKVDDLMRLCDRLEAQQQEREKLRPLLSRANHTRFVTEPTAANLGAIFHDSGAASPEEFRTTILTLAVEGTLLTSEHPPVMSSLNSVLAEPSSNGVSTGPTKDTGATEILRISAGTSRSDFFVDEEDFKHVDLPQKEIEKHRLRTGDLLACRFNGNLRFVGRFSFYRGESGRVQVNPDKLIRFRVDTSKHCPRYVCFAMNSDPTRKAIEALCATTAGNIGLSAGKLKNVELPLPELEQQRRIAERITQLMEIVDRLESKRKQASVIAESFAKAAVAAITSTEFTENERMKPPKTEVVTALKVGKRPKKPDAAPLATLLSEQKAEASAKSLWQLSGLEIDAFYRQLKTEMANGWIEESHRAFVRENFEIWPKINELKGRLGWEEVRGTARAWWDSFERENRHRPEFLLRILERLVLKRLTIESFFENNAIQITDVRTVTEALPYVDEAAIESLFMEEAESKS